MNTDLIQRIRTCSTDERRTLALELARERSDASVAELIRIAEAGDWRPDQWGKVGWWGRLFGAQPPLISLGTWEFSARDQLIAIEALGDTESKKGLECLTKIGTVRYTEEHADNCLGGSYGTGVYHLSFPRALGNLKWVLELDWTRENHEWIERLLDDRTETRPHSKLISSTAKQYIEKQRADAPKKRLEEELFSQNQAYLILKKATEKLEATTIPCYAYTCYNIDKYPDLFDDAHRRPEYGEWGNITYALLHPSQPYDDDSLLLRWNASERRWIMSLSLGIGGGEFPDGESIGLDSDSERAGLMLLTHFGLLDRRGEFAPSKLGYLSPEELTSLGKQRRTA